MIKILVPKFCVNEFDYIIRYIFTTLYFVEFEIIHENRDNVCIYENSYKDRIEIKCDFFLTVKDSWLAEDPLKNVEYYTYKSQKIPPIGEFTLPILFGKNFVENNANICTVHFDIFGTCFYLLSGYEELVNPKFDKHGRICGKFSNAFKYDFYLRPLVNEYAHFLMTVIEARFGKKYNANTHFQINVTCDLDWPFQPERVSWYHFMKNTFILLRSGEKVISILQKQLKFFRKNYFDANFRGILRIIKECKKNDLEATFYVMPNNTHKYDAIEPIHSKRMRKLTKLIQGSGHTIGVHPGYKCCADKEQMRTALAIFYRELEINDDAWIDLRMHYLMWDNVHTLESLEDYKVIDSTLGFADLPGFRRGVCTDFKIYNLVKRCVSPILERPLHVMEASVLSSEYLNCSDELSALSLMGVIKEKCRSYNGCFTLLWHNCGLREKSHRTIFTSIIRR